ncbi:MAG: DUF1499 domain-containing protein [Nitrospiraceae bacterium]|nr:DUF1499 domain-containing protein [Nitrospiraceae bacterium]
MKTTVWKEELQYHEPYPVIALIGFGLAVLAGLAALLSGLGSRWGWWYFGTGFIILGVSALIGAISALAEFVISINLRGASARHILAFAVAGIVIGLAAAAVPAAWLRTAFRMPPIHDITTDMQNPPSFVALMPLRTDAPNPAAYGGPAIASQQQAAFPQVRPLILPLSPPDAFRNALAEARRMGWTIVDANAKEGRIEATATTFWFGFTDDIVVRVKPDDNGSRIDVRSVSRVGKGDLGTNARRVMAYLKTLGMES